MSPVMAKPLPASCPPDWLMRNKEMWPKMIPGIVKMPQIAKASIEQIKLTIALGSVST